MHRIRDEGRRRLAERTWRAWRLADRYGFDGALGMLLERAVASSAGRVRESEERRAALVTGILVNLGYPTADPVEALATRAVAGRAALIEAMRAGGLGEARAGEVAWNVALPLVAALAAAYDDVALAGDTISGNGATAKQGGALYAQGLLHLQDLWCSRGGCGVCPLSVVRIEQGED